VEAEESGKSVALADNRLRGHFHYPDAIQGGVAKIRELFDDPCRLDRMTEILEEKRHPKGVSVRCGSNDEIRTRWNPIHVNPRQGESS